MPADAATFVIASPDAPVVRRLPADELPWANATYAGIGFALSTPEDFLVGAEVGGVRAGLGRLVPVGPDAAEMGGIYTFPEFRRHGVASALVRHLVDHSPYRRLYCVPFVPLEPFYRRFGFDSPRDGETIHEAVRDKVSWCTGRYPDPVSLLVREAS